MGLKVSSKRFVLSDETRNLYGFITKTLGIDLSAFQDNPVMLYNHDYNKLIGQWQDLRIEGNKLTASPAFDEDDTFAMQQYNKVEEGILKGASIGISPVKFDELSAEMTNSLLLEASLTPVPNNKKALALYSLKGDQLNASEIPQYLLSVERTEPPINNPKMKEKLILALVALCVQAGHTITLSATSTEDEIEGAIKKVGAHIAELNTAKTNLTAEVKKLNDDADAAAAKSLDEYLTDAVNKKMLSADDVPAMKVFGQANLSAMKKVVDALKPIEVKTLETSTAKVVDLSGDRAKWTYDDFAEKAPRDLEAMEITNPELFKKLSADKVASVRSKVEIPA